MHYIIRQKGFFMYSCIHQHIFLALSLFYYLNSRQATAAPESTRHLMLHVSCHTNTRLHHNVTLELRQEIFWVISLSTSAYNNLELCVCVCVCVCRNSAFVELLYGVENDDDEFILPISCADVFTKQGENFVK